MAILVAAGYGGYTIIKDKELESLRSGQTALYEAKRVIDGDTFELEDGEIVRLLAIDAPDAKECYFEESKEALRKLVEGKNVELRKDVSEADKYGRLLRYLVLPPPDGRLVNLEMVRKGHARVLTRFPFSRKSDYLREEERAIKGVFDAAKAGFISISTGDDMLRPILDYFKRRSNIVKS